LISKKFLCRSYFDLDDQSSETYHRVYDADLEIIKRSSPLDPPSP